MQLNILDEKVLQKEKRKKELIVKKLAQEKEQQRLAIEK
jgi:hypothetical protein